MFLLNRRQVLLSGGAVATASVFPHLASAQSDPLAVHTASPENFAVDSIAVMGAQKALVIDGQMMAAEAAQLADDIAATGRVLETIFVTHIHPDHHFGIGVLKARWPEARVVAHPAVAELLGQIGQGMFDERKAFMGDALPDLWIAPEAHEGQLTLEGESFDVLDPMVGDTPLTTPVLMPQFDALVGSDILFADTPLWLGETGTAEALAGWRNSLDQLEAMGVGNLIPGHRLASSDNSTVFDYTRGALDVWETIVADARNPEEMKDLMVDRLGYPRESFFVDRGAEAAFGGGGE